MNFTQVQSCHPATARAHVVTFMSYVNPLLNFWFSDTLQFEVVKVIKFCYLCDKVCVMRKFSCAGEFHASLIAKYWLLKRVENVFCYVLSVVLPSFFDVSYFSS